MAKKKRIDLFFGAFYFLIAGMTVYSSNKFDGSSEENFIKSMNSITSQMDQEKAKEFTRQIIPAST